MNRIIRYAINQDDGQVISRVGDELAWPILDWDHMQPENNFETRYQLKKVGVLEVQCDWRALKWTKKIPKELKNLHRAFWGMRALTAAIALAAVLALSAPALADEDCKNIAVEITIEANLSEPAVATIIEHECVRRDTVPIIIPLEPVASNFRWWFQFPAERGLAVIYTGLVPQPMRVLAILRRVEVDS